MREHKRNARRGVEVLIGRYVASLAVASARFLNLMNDLFACTIRELAWLYIQPTTVVRYISPFCKFHTVQVIVSGREFRDVYRVFQTIKFRHMSERQKKFYMWIIGLVY